MPLRAMRSDSHTAHKRRNIERNPAREARSFGELPWAYLVPNVVDSADERWRRTGKRNLRNYQLSTRILRKKDVKSPEDLLRAASFPGTSMVHSVDG
jgi:hypothetical protein